MLGGFLCFFLVQSALTAGLIAPCLCRLLPKWTMLRTTMISALPFPILLIAAPFLHDARNMTMNAAMAVSVMAFIAYAANTVVVFAILRTRKR